MATASRAALLAYVLHRYDWSETSLIVELFTREQGRIVVVAKGAKRPTSQLRPVLLPFQPVLASLGRQPASAEAELQLLRAAEWVGGRPLLAPAAMFAGFYLNELLLKLLARQDAHARLFDLYADTLMALATQDAEAATLRAFELLLLRALGWLPELSTATLTTRPLDPSQSYALDPESGLVERAGGLSGLTWTGLEAALASADASADASPLRAACAPLAAALRAPLRTMLHYHGGHSLLRTRQVWHGVQRLAHGARPTALAGSNERP